VLVHPARLDVTGTVILEALGAGLPVVTTENCGYASHVRDAGAGKVVHRESKPDELAAAASPTVSQRQAWSIAAQAYVRRTELTRGLDVAASFIEQVAAESAG
jgi:UDP-glucose:(heptosyl)LPS alpha-1,3-glucosyltransferase